MIELENKLIAPIHDPHQVRRTKLDAMLLGYMARRLHLTIRRLEAADFVQSRPLLFLIQERRGRTHRIALYYPEELLTQVSLCFVGFLSGRQKPPQPSVLQAIQRADKNLVTELADTSGVLSYSSLELRNGEWCNLVVLSDSSAKKNITGSQTHQHAAYCLAHSYYAWIRLHSGVMPEGLDHLEMHIQKTRCYSFHLGQVKPSIRELIYDEPSRVELLSTVINGEHPLANGDGEFRMPMKEN